MTERPSPHQTVTEPRAKLLDLSLPQLVGGSLAAATAAALGSRLGVVGTITGAAVGSVITAVAANLYTNSMSRAHRALVTTLRPGATLHRVVAVDAEPMEASPSGLTRPALGGPSRRRRSWTGPLVSATVVFAVAAAFLTGLQLATGASVTGTTVGTQAGTAGRAGTDRGSDLHVAPGDAVASHTSEPAPTPSAGNPASPTADSTAPSPTSPEPTTPTEEPSATQPSPPPDTSTVPATPTPTG